MIATGLLCYLSGLIDASITNFDTTHGAAYVGLSNVFLLTLLIMAAGPGSGGHVNPTITFATMVTGLTGLARGITTPCAQWQGDTDHHSTRGVVPYLSDYWCWNRRWSSARVIWDC